MMWCKLFGVSYDNYFLKGLMVEREGVLIWESTDDRVLVIFYNFSLKGVSFDGENGESNLVKKESELGPQALAS